MCLSDTQRVFRLRDQNCCAFKPAGTEIGEGLIGLVERIGRRLGDDSDLRRQAEEINSVLSRQIGQPTRAAALPSGADRGSSVCRSYGCPRKPRDPPLRTALSATGTRSPTVGKDDCSIERLRRHLVGSAAHVTPRCRAKAWVATSPGLVNANADRPCHSATCATI